MIMNSKTFDGLSFTLDDSYRNRFYPEWVIQVWKEVPLTAPMWEDASAIRGYGYYGPDQDLSGDVGGINFRPLRLYPEDLKVKLDELRAQYPDKQFRMVMRVEAQKVLDDEEISWS